MCMCACVCVRARASRKRPVGVLGLGGQVKGVILVAFLLESRRPGGAGSSEPLGLRAARSGDFLPVG